MTLQQSPFLRNQRDFPDDDITTLCTQIDQMYIDVAQKVNSRTIGIFPVNYQSITGEKWFLQGVRSQQTLRQVYTFTAAGSIAHGITWSSVSQITKPSGSYTNGTNWYGVIYASSVAIAGQATFYITPTSIVIQLGAGAPAISSGSIILEWLSVV